MSWEKINQAVGIPLQTPFIVWNGERVGEAVLRETYDYTQDDVTTIYLWAWTHHSTCSCCHSFIKPQPTMFQPMPFPPQT